MIPNNSFVFQPGGIAGGNIFTTWASLYAQLSQATGSRWIYVDDSISSPAHITSGTYNLDGVTITGIGNYNSNTGGASIQIDSGAIITGTNLTLYGLLDITYVGTTSCITCSGASQEYNLFINNGCFIQSTSTGPFLSCSNGFVVITANNFSGIGDATHTTLSCTGGTIELNLFSGSTVYANALNGSGIVAGYDDASLIKSPQTGSPTTYRQSKAANAAPSMGTTSNRPTSPLTGDMYFDSTIASPIWYNGSAWVLANVPASGIGSVPYQWLGQTSPNTIALGTGGTQTVSAAQAIIPFFLVTTGSLTSNGTVDFSTNASTGFFMVDLSGATTLGAFSIVLKNGSGTINITASVLTALRAAGKTGVMVSTNGTNNITSY